MQFKNTVNLWGGIAQALHWTMAVLILQQLASGHYMVFLGPGEGQDRCFYLFHKPLGVLILVLLVARLGWQLTNPVPVCHQPCRAGRWAHLMPATRDSIPSWL